MKKLMMIILLAFAGNMLQAQTPSQTPTPVTDRFKASYPDVTGVYWKTESDNAYRVNYMQKDVQHAVVYDKNGNMISEESVMNATMVPSTIADYYKKRAASDPNYSNYTVWQTTDSKGNKTYYSDYKGKMTYFDSNGNLTTKRGMAAGDEMDHDKMRKDK